MQKIENFFTHLKAWQLFLLMVAIPLVVQFTAMRMVMGTLDSESTPEDAFQLFQQLWGTLSGLMAIFMLIILGWFWSCGIELNRRIDPSNRKKTTLFKTAVIFPLIYMPFFMVVFSPGPHPPDSFGFTGIITLLHMFSMFCMFYLLYFVSWSLATVLNQSGQKVRNHSVYFFALWFYPVGIWLVQPKINKIVRDEIAEPIA